MLHSGDNPSRAIVSRIAVREGDRVGNGQFILEIETDAITMEIHAPYAGTVVAVHVREGDEVSTDSDMVEIRPE